MRHPIDQLQRLDSLASQQIPIICGGALDGGFLTGGTQINGRAIDLDDPADQSLVTWRKAFTSLCHGYGVRPAHACIQFSLQLPGVVAVSMRTSSPERVRENIEAALNPVPEGLWASMREEGLLAEEFRFSSEQT
jgi:D-threo-aldose 1-dehydrogenase